MAARLGLLALGLALGYGLARVSAKRRPRKGRRVALVDNGSLKPEATKSLRRLAAALAAKAGLKVEAVSAKFADRIAAEKLDGQPGEVLAGWLQRVKKEDPDAQVQLLPLLIGPSDTLTKAMPEAAQAADVEVEIAPSLVCLCPVLYGHQEERGAHGLAQMLRERLEDAQLSANDVVLLCDHGSPAARVAAAKDAVRAELAALLGRPVTGCCMERREGAEYDFNGPLLEKALQALPPNTSAKVALLFLQEGRHAGPGGDIDQILGQVKQKRPDLSLATTRVLAGHEGLVELLAKRLRKTVPARLFH